MRENSDVSKEEARSISTTIMPWNDAFRTRENGLLTSLSSHKMLLYASISSIAVSATVASALRRHSNFYSLAIHLSKSNRSVLVSIRLQSV